MGRPHTPRQPAFRLRDDVIDRRRVRAAVAADVAVAPEHDRGDPLPVCAIAAQGAERPQMNLWNRSDRKPRSAGKVEAAGIEPASAVAPAERLQA